MFIKRPIQDFQFFFDDAMLDNKYRNHVDRPYRPPATLNSDLTVGQPRYYTDLTGALGYGLQFTGEITNIYKHRFVENALKRIIPHAIYSGGSWLTCFEGKLSSMYEDYGFQIIGAEEFNNNYAAENWNYKEFGQPSIVTMRYIV